MPNEAAEAVDQGMVGIVGGSQHAPCNGGRANRFHCCEADIRGPPIDDATAGRARRTLMIPRQNWDSKRSNECDLIGSNHLIWST